jgi:hypothetical protein
VLASRKMHLYREGKLVLAKGKERKLYTERPEISFSYVRHGRSYMDQ